jgi:hypothetical protein
VHNRKARTVLGVLAGVAIAAASATPAQAAAGAWRIVPDPEAPSTLLQSVFTASPMQAWAVGYTFNDDTGATSPVIEHWDGTSWQKASGASLPGGNFQLDTVAGTGPDDVWAAGGQPEFGPAVIEHFNGTAWAQVASPVSDGGLAEISADSPADAWGIGTNLFGCCVALPAIQHWNGTAWTLVNDAFVTGLDDAGATLLSIDAVSASDVWVVAKEGFTTFFGHWDGTAWQKVAQPKAAGQGQLAAVGGTSASDLWAVGDSTNQSGLIEHFNGTTWSVVANPAGQGIPLGAVSVLRPHDVWAMGSAVSVSEHWNGTKWTAVPAVNVNKASLTLPGQDGYGGPPMSGRSGGPLFAVANETSTTHSVIIQQETP